MDKKGINTAIVVLSEPDALENVLDSLIAVYETLADEGGGPDTGTGQALLLIAEALDTARAEVSEAVDELEEEGYL